MYKCFHIVIFKKKHLQELNSVERSLSFIIENIFLTKLCNTKSIQLAVIKSGVNKKL